MDIELKHGFKYHYANDEHEAKFITISAFTMKQMSMVAPIKEIVMKAMGRYAERADLSATDLAEMEDAAKVAKAEAEAKKEEDSKKMSSEQMMTIIAMNCGEGDLGKLWAYMQKLLTSGVAYIDASDTKFSGTYINDLNPADFENLCGEYIGNFII